MWKRILPTIVEGMKAVTPPTLPPIVRQRTESLAKTLSDGVVVLDTKPGGFAVKAKVSVKPHEMERGGDLDLDSPTPLQTSKFLTTKAALTVETPSKRYQASVHATLGAEASLNLQSPGGSVKVGAGTSLSRKGDETPDGSVRKVTVEAAVKSSVLDMDLTELGPPTASLSRTFEDLRTGQGEKLTGKLGGWNLPTLVRSDASSVDIASRFLAEKESARVMYGSLQETNKEAVDRLYVSNMRLPGDDYGMDPVVLKEILDEELNGRPALERAKDERNLTHKETFQRPLPLEVLSEPLAQIPPSPKPSVRDALGKPPAPEGEKLGPSEGSKVRDQVRHGSTQQPPSPSTGHKTGGL